MTSISLNIAAQLVGNWVSLYTKGLPEETVASRRQEVDSDVWEQSNDGTGYDHSSRYLALHILGRWVFGIGDDLSWRQEQMRELKEQKAGNLAERNYVMNFASMIIRPRTYVNLVLVLAAMFLLFPIGIGAFVAAVVSVVVPFALIAAPFIYRWEPIELGLFVVDTLPEALLTSIVGLILLALVIAIANVIVGILGRFVSIQVGRF